jgi:hypothetical protein
VENLVFSTNSVGTTRYLCKEKRERKEEEGVKEKK